MLTGKRNKMRNLWLGLATVIFALAVAPTNASAQKRIPAQTTIGAGNQSSNTAVVPCNGDKALEPACLKQRLDALEQTVTSMSADLKKIKVTLKMLNSQIGDNQADGTTSNLWQAIGKLSDRLKAHGW